MFCERFELGFLFLFFSFSFSSFLHVKSLREHFDSGSSGDNGNAWCSLAPYLTGTRWLACDDDAARALARWFDDCLCSGLFEANAIASIDESRNVVVDVDDALSLRAAPMLPCVPLGHITELLAATLWTDAYRCSTRCSRASSDDERALRFMRLALHSHCVDVDDALRWALLRSVCAFLCCIEQYITYVSTNRQQATCVRLLLNYDAGRFLSTTVDMSLAPQTVGTGASLSSSSTPSTPTSASTSATTPATTVTSTTTPSMSSSVRVVVDDGERRYAAASRARARALARRTTSIDANHAVVVVADGDNAARIDDGASLDRDALRLLDEMFDGDGDGDGDGELTSARRATVRYCVSFWCFSCQLWFFCFCFLFCVGGSLIAGVMLF